MDVPYEVPVGQLGVFGGVGLDGGKCGRHFPARIGGQLADNFTNEESIVEVVGSARREEHSSLLVLLACVTPSLPVLAMILAATSHS
jgi:hypothetical protein